MFGLPHYVVVIAVLSLVVAFFVCQKCVDFVAGVQRRRHLAGQLAPKLAQRGFVEFPQFLINYSTGGYVQLVKQLEKLFHTFDTNPDAILEEADAVGKRMLDAKLATPEGLAWVQAQVASATKATA